MSRHRITVLSLRRFLRFKLLTNHRRTASGCWEWIGPFSDQGYGLFRVPGLTKRVIPAHRVSAHLFFGFDLLSKLFVCHHCDNPPCVNPLHLYAGTHQDNVRDMVERNRLCRGNAHHLAHDGTQPTGEDHWARRRPEVVRRGQAVNTCRLSEEQVSLIRVLASQGHSQRGLARMFGVDRCTVKDIVRRITWRHVPG